MNNTLGEVLCCSQIQSPERSYRFGRGLKGFLEMMTFELGHSIGEGICQRHKGRKRWEDISCRGNGVKRTLGGIVFAA